MYDVGKKGIGNFIFVVIIISLFILAVFMFSPMKYKLTTYTLFIRFSNAFGLTEGSPVMIKGIKVGVVKGIHLENKDNIIVNVRIKKKYTIPIDSKILIMDNTFMGDKKIEIMPGDSLRTYAYNDTVNGIYASGIEQIKQLMGTIVPSGSTTSSTKVNELVQDVLVIMEGLKTIIEKEDEIFSFAYRIDSLARISKDWVDRNDGRMEQTLINLNKSLYSFNKSSQELDSLVREMRYIVKSINEGNGTIGKLLYSDSLYNDMRDVVKDADSLLIDIRKNPEKYGKLNIKLF